MVDKTIDRNMIALIGNFEAQALGFLDMTWMSTQGLIQRADFEASQCPTVADRMSEPFFVLLSQLRWSWVLTYQQLDACKD